MDVNGIIIHCFNLGFTQVIVVEVPVQFRGFGLQLYRPYLIRSGYELEDCCGIAPEHLKAVTATVSFLLARFSPKDSRQRLLLSKAVRRLHAIIRVGACTTKSSGWE